MKKGLKSASTHYCGTFLRINQVKKKHSSNYTGRVGLNHFPSYNNRIGECLLCDMRKVGEREVGRRGRGRGEGRGEGRGKGGRGKVGEREGGGGRGTAGGFGGELIPRPDNTVTNLPF